MEQLPATIEECNDEQRRLQAECVAIRGKMELADARGTSDKEWTTRCQSAIRHRKASIRALSVRKAHIYGESHAAFDAAFRQTAIATLPPETVELVYGKLHQFHPEFEGRYE